MAYMIYLSAAERGMERGRVERERGNPPSSPYLTNLSFPSLYAKQYCAAIFIDLAKAFDTIDHSILVGRLRSIDVSEGSLGWVANYLSQRVQCMKSENLLSQPHPVTKGVQQGSILGPTLFSIYINSIAQVVGSSLIHLYADDTVLFSAGPSPDFVLNALQQFFLSVQKAFSTLNLVLNTSKTN